MRKLRKHDARALFGISLADMSFAITGVILVLFIIILTIPKNDHEGDNIGGSICAELTWDNDRDVDLDLWGKAPKGDAIGFTNMHSPYLNLFRDVLGFYLNPSHQMVEVMCSSTIIPGEWTFNGVFFRDHEEDGHTTHEPGPIMARVTIYITVPDGQGGSSKKVFTKVKELSEIEMEKTFIDFVIKSDGVIDMDSINDNYRNIKGLISPSTGIIQTPDGLVQRKPNNTGELH